ncbi:hypothetical protein QTP70_006591 [Hemibagrus guttatus]|uniref:Protein Shroom2 n=1 Tax=Hemibagrus guttatus TaxID=175788 RepID=A0AAE0V0U9_9TELE|nr:hypothetical protein QTP70_006591 [Hemibagrus guttatus]
MEIVGACPTFGAPTGEPRSKTIKDRDTWTSMEQHAGPVEEKWLLVDVILFGGAPWGFTLRGGLEYQEPLIITKVEEGSRAASAQLQVGDEIVSINAVPLSGYRQEAICLVKSSFKTLALGLKRKNEPLCRPQSWHSPKVSENSTEAHETEDTAVLEPVWQTKCDASSSSNDFWSQTNLQHVSCQFSSVGNMELVEHSSNTHHVGAENLATTRAGDKHNSGYRAFSSCTPEQRLSESAAASECMFYQGSQREHCKYLQIAVGNEGCISPKIEDEAGSRFFSSGRLNINPVLHVPETSSVAYSPPPPAPPLRNDSFTTAKVHEKGLGIPYSHGHPAHSHQKCHSRVTDRTADAFHFSQQGLQSQHSYNPTSPKDFLQVQLSAEDYCPNELNTTKLYSLSSTDVRQGQNPFACQPRHQRQRSDESPFYLYPKNRFAPKMQSEGIYYYSLQNIPTNLGFQKQTGSPIGSLSSTALDNSSDGMANYRYYCITSDECTQEFSDGVGEHKWRPESEPTHASSDRNQANYQRTIKLKYPLNSLQASVNKSYKHTVSPPKLEALGPATVKSNSGKKEKENPWRKDGTISESQHSNNIVNQQAAQRYFTREHKDTENGHWIPKNGQKICPQKTPLLHSLAHENRILAESPTITTKGCTLQEKPDPASSKQGRRSDRYATILLNEIQEKRAQLQKSRSAATLICPGEFEEDLGVWKSTETSTSSSDGSFTSTYKDYLKEAQARVLQATSFKRRDLELPGNETFHGQLATKSESTNGHVSRIGSRKRFPLDKRVHSFSEPDKMNEVGVEVKTSEQATLGSFVDRFKFFEGASRPTFSKPIPKNFQLNPSENITGGKNRFTLHVDETEIKSAKKQQFSSNKCYTTAEEQQRLGTFAEYEATWNLQRKTVGGRTSSRCHSAENILDSGIGKGNSTVCIHERSRSSPSADFHGEKISLSAEKPLEATHPENTLDPEKIHSDSTSEKRQHQLNISEPLEFSRRNDQEHKDMTQPLNSTHTTKGSCPPHLLHFQDSVAELSSSNKGSATQKPSGHNEYEFTQIETISSSSLNESLHTGDPQSAVVPSPTPKFPFPHCGAEALQFSSSEVQKLDSTETAKLSVAPIGLSEEDEKREELARDIMGMDKSLVDILDQSKMKTTMDLMEGIYPQGEQLLEGLQQRRKSTSKPKTTQEKGDDKMTASASLATSSSYYNTSAPKAELLIKMKDMQEQMKEQGSEDELEYDLSGKKQELIDSLSRKLQVLREARESLLEDMQDNNTLGEEVEATVQTICKPNELDKFRMFVGDLDKVVSLLLSLSGRLARVENALNNLEEGFSAEEKHTLTEKRKLLICQHEDAKELKENLDRRERLVYEILASYLSEERLADYQHFVKMKSALIIEQRKLEDRIKLGEEQLKCLKDSLPLEQRLGY